MNSLGNFFNAGPFMPHGHCYFWTTSLIALHAISDACIVLAYYSIPFTLIYFVRKRKDLKFHWMFVCFAVFILACGTTHLMEIWNIWHANYWLSGSIKAITALASVPTAFLLVKLIPQALAIPSPKALEKAYAELEERVAERTAQLKIANEHLVREVRERRQAEQTARENQKLLQAIIDNSPAIIYVKNLQGRYLLVNRRFSELFHHPPDAVLGKTDDDLFKPAEAAAFRAMDERVIAADHPLTEEETVPQDDGPHAYVSFKCPLWDETGKPYALFGISTDITERKNSEQVQARLAAIVNSSEDAIISKTLDGIVTSWNAGAENLFGCPAAEAIGKPMIKFFPPERVDEEAKILELIAHGEHIEHFETQRVRKDGKRLDVSVSVSPIKDSHGKIVGAAKIARDISERKNVDAALRESQALYHSLVEQMPAGVFRKDSEGRYVFVNSWFCQLSGTTPEHYLGKTPPETAREFAAHHSTLLEPDKVMELAASGAEDHARIMQTGQRIEVEESHALTDGRKQYLHVTKAPVFDSAAKIVGSQGILIDITERKQAEEILRRSEERYRSLFDTLIEGFCTIEMIFDDAGKPVDYRFLEINPAFESQTGLRNAQGKLMRELVPDHEAHWFEIYGKIALTGEAIHFENEAKALGRYYDVCAYRIGGPGSRKVAILFNDITARKQAQAEILQLNAELEQRVAKRTAELEAANKELEAFSYSVSHDLRAPLRAISGFASIVLEDFSTQLPEEGRHYLERVRNGGQRMGQLIDDLLAFSRLSRQPLNRRLVDTARLVQEVLTELNPREDNRPIEIRVGNLPPSHGDPALLKQIWINLLSNAIKYSRGRQPAIVEAGSEQKNGETVYFVRDNGVGFDMQYANKLFGVFQRLHRPDEFEGTGVGLAIVQRVVHRHGGRVWAEAAPDRGATFYFTLEPE